MLTVAAPSGSASWNSAGRPITCRNNSQNLYTGGQSFQLITVLHKYRPWDKVTIREPQCPDSKLYLLHREKRKNMRLEKGHGYHMYSCVKAKGGGRGVGSQLRLHKNRGSLPIYSSTLQKNNTESWTANIPRKGIARPQSQFLQSCVCERLIYSHDRSAFLLQENMWTDPGNI